MNIMKRAKNSYKVTNKNLKDIFTLVGTIRHNESVIIGKLFYPVFIGMMSKEERDNLMTEEVYNGGNIT